MAQIPSNQGCPQFSNICAQDALPLIGSLARENGQSVLNSIDSDLAKLFENQNIILTDGGLITFLGTSVQFTQPLKLEVNSKIAGGAPVIINLGSTTRTVSATGRMIYAVIDRVAGTATVTDDASTLPSVVAANKEVFLIAKRSDSADGIKRIYFRNGMALDEGQTARLGASGSGAGNANERLETLKNRFVESPFSLLTPYIVQTDEDNLLDGSSTADYDLVTKTISFPSIGDTFVSTQLADSNEFLNNTDPIGSVELLAFWKLANIDILATYEVSRNGGNEWQEITMERIGNTDTYRGIYDFISESSTQVLASQSVDGALSSTLNTTTNIQLGQIFTITNNSFVKQFRILLQKNGSIVGNLYVQLVKDSAGYPSTTLSDIVAESSAINISSLSSGLNTITVPIGTYLTSGSYHIVIRTDSIYKTDPTNGFLNGVRSIAWRSANTTPVGSKFNGTSWSADSYAFYYYVDGISIDLRVKITSGSTNVNLDGIGLFYDKEVSGISTGTLNRESFYFDGSANTYSFTLTKFVPNADLLKVYDVLTGQVYTYGSFSLDGQTVNFESGQFYSPGQYVNLVFDQVNGGAFDNSDLNALLLANNHLGSIDTSIDRSVAGRGIFLRRPDGTLREICIDNSDNIAVYSV